MASSSLGLSLAVLFAMVALGLVAFGFSTDHWVRYTVDMEKLAAMGYENDVNTKEHYNTRHRGLFRECYSNRTRVFLFSRTIDINCKYTEYEVPESDKFEQRSENYKAMIQLRRCVVGFLIIAMLFFVIAIALGGLGCWRATKNFCTSAGVLTLLAVLFGVLGMAFFHGAKTLEDNKVQETDLMWLKSNWNVFLVQHTRMTFQWSYILCWCGLGMGIISAVLFLITSWITKQKEKDQMRLLSDRYSMRSRAYEYFDFPNFTSDKGSVRGGYVGPYDMDENRPRSTAGNEYVDPSGGTWKWERDAAAHPEPHDQRY